MSRTSIADASQVGIGGWKKSSFSGPTGGNCVETAALAGGGIAVRDSWSPAGPALIFPAGTWAAFLGRCRGAEAG
jgi:hypothetical protein